MFDIWHIGIPVKNLAATLKFYTEVLDFELLGTFEGTMGFVRPPGKSFTLEFMETPVDDAKFNQRPHHLAFERKELESFRHELQAQGFLGAISEIKNSVAGMRVFTVQDPDGIDIQFYHGKAGFENSIRL